MKLCFAFMDASKLHLWVKPSELCLLCFSNSSNNNYYYNYASINNDYAFQVLDEIKNKSELLLLICYCSLNLVRICFNYAHTFLFWHFLCNCGLGGHFLVAFSEPSSGHVRFLATKVWKKVFSVLLGPKLNQIPLSGCCHFKYLFKVLISVCFHYLNVWPYNAQKNSTTAVQLMPLCTLCSSEYL